MKDLVGDIEAQKSSMIKLRDKLIANRPAGVEYDPTNPSLEHVCDDISSGVSDVDYEFDFMTVDSSLAHVCNHIQGTSA